MRASAADRGSRRPIGVAIVGSGPAGFYAAEALLAGGGDVRIDILDRLPTPFGLIRDGVAPDHQTTKKVALKFERTALKPEVRFYGNVAVGRDVMLDDLRSMYDAVILAVGTPLDRPLGIPGEDKSGVYGSAAFVGWYNGHPDFRDLDPDLGTPAAAIVGNGNVALDVARVLAKTEVELADSDLVDHAAQAIHAAPIADIHILGRRGPAEAKFTNVELREMGQLRDCVPLADPAQLGEAIGPMSDRDRRLREKNLATLAGFADLDAGTASKRAHFRFFAVPTEILGGDRVEGVRVARARLEDGRLVLTGETFEIPCGLVISAIGYRSQPITGAPFDADRGIVPNDDGRVADGLYAVGWIKRGPTGVIASNRPDGVAVATSIRAAFDRGRKPGRQALDALLARAGARPVGYAGWQRIDAAERANATPPAPRRKFTRVAEMLAVLDAAPDRGDRQSAPRGAGEAARKQPAAT
ncbi:MAG: FAD-dependent oxidoreductase [Alphaproteobacteria bacterium]